MAGTLAVRTGAPGVTIRLFPRPSRGARIAVRKPGTCMIRTLNLRPGYLVALGALGAAALSASPVHAQAGYDPDYGQTGGNYPPAGQYNPPPGEGQEPPIPPYVEGAPVQAESGGYCYVGPHPVDTRMVPGPAFEDVQGQNIRPYPPVDLRLFSFRDGCYY